jgi:hypothetical protein
VSDPIDDAINATQGKIPQLHRYTVPLPTTGRHAYIELPMDSTGDDLIEAAVGILILIRADRVREESAAASPIVVATRMPQ